MSTPVPDPVPGPFPPGFASPRSLRAPLRRSASPHQAGPSPERGILHRLSVFDSLAKPPKHARQILDLIAGVEAARVRQDPEGRPFERLGLEPQDRTGTLERRPVGSDA